MLLTGEFCSCNLPSSGYKHVITFTSGPSIMLTLHLAKNSIIFCLKNNKNNHDHVHYSMALAFYLDK